jgi:hypothetical protein
MLSQLPTHRILDYSRYQTLRWRQRLTTAQRPENAL